MSFTVPAIRQHKLIRRKTGMRRRSVTALKISAIGLTAVAWVLVTSPAVLAQAQQENSETMLTYSRGQAILPAYEGFHPNADGTIDLWFGYLNQNYQEELDIPIGPDNMISPAMYGPD